MIEPRTDGVVFPKLKFDPICYEYGLKDKLVKTGDTEDDFIVVKVPVVLDKYNISEVVAARAEGCELKTICKRMQAGEVMPIGRSPQYVDDSKSPKTLSEALEIKKKTEAIIDGAHLTKEQVLALKPLIGMDPKDIEKLVRESYSKIRKDSSKAGAAEANPIKVDPVVSPAVETKEVK